jgi:type III secretion protein C
MMNHRSIIKIFYSLVLSLGLYSTVSAADPPWPESRYSYFAEKTVSVTKVLGDFSKQFGVRLNLSPKVKGMMSGRLNAESPKAFLDQLGAMHGFTWYYRQGTIYVNDSTENINKAVQLPPGNIRSLKQALTGMGLLDDRFGWGELPEQGVLMLSGPPSYVRSLEQALQQVPAASLAGQKIQVFRLNHAPVDNRVFSYRNQMMTIPGVANILRTIVAGGDPGSIGTRTQVVEASTPLRLRAKEQQLHNSTSVGHPEKDAPNNPAIPPSSSDTGLSGAGGNAIVRGTAIIESDPRLNTVIIRDTPEMMSVYDRLIKLLDQPTALIEIEALIVDVKSNKMDELGIDWRFGRGGRGQLGFGATSTLGSASIATVGSAFPSVLAAAQLGRFLGRLRALETEGEASVVSRPSVLTMSNQAAVIDLSQTHYVALTGERVSDLAEITAGTLLKVTPRLIGGLSDKNRQIEVFVDLEDGQLSETGGGSSLPTVSRGTVSTQAVVGENTSLLIAGHRRKETRTEESRVPVLGSLPIVGGLFRSTTKSNNVSDRLFLLTPRIVPVIQSGSEVDARSRIEPSVLDLDGLSPAEKEELERRFIPAAPIYIDLNPPEEVLP